MSAEHIRICPGCGTESAPATLRCQCGVLLAGVDITLKQDKNIQYNQYVINVVDSSSALICAHADCAQANPPGSTSCVYCNRPLSAGEAVTQSEPLQSLLNLPGALKTRYRISKHMPTRGAEAELLLIQAQAGGQELVAKIYRHGILPKREVQDRIKRISTEHRVNVLEEGISDGHAYEVMEWIAHGSLRDMLDNGALAPAVLHAVIRELAIALRAVHAVNLVHRDLKPENVLIRAHQPLDLVLTDFSISSVLDVTQRFTGVARTLPYASPESLSGVIDFKSDYWALGMIVLEAALGKHPFAGLSEAVIMHHLTTRNVDVTTVADANLRKLLLGFLQRDPALRWGDAEIRRWLQHDTSLAEPVVHSIVGAFREPYHLGEEVCHQPQQLAVALARNWKEGLQDISNGQLLAWFRDVQRDQNIVRLLIDMRSQASLSLNVQLLRLILKLAPGMPPVWQGETIELSTILSYANKALQGDNDAAWWLDNLYKNRVIETYAETGNQQAADLLQRWNHALAQFNAAWQDKIKLISDNSAARDPDRIPDFDELMYGRKDPLKPNLVQMHARLLAMAYDNSWADRLRKSMQAEVLALVAQCDWIGNLGDPQSMDAPSLLVLEALLPEAKESVAHQLQKNQSRQAAEKKEFQILQQEMQAVLSNIHHVATTSASSSDELRGLLNEYHRMVVKIRASGRTDKDWNEFKKKTLRSATAARIMQERIGELERHRAISAGWFNLRTLGFFVMATFFSFTFVPGLAVFLILAAGGIATLRVLGFNSISRSIQELGRHFQI